MVTNVKVNIGNELNEVKLPNSNLSVKLTDLLYSVIHNKWDYEINRFEVKRYASYVRYEFNIRSLISLQIEDSDGIITSHTMSLLLDGSLELTNYFIRKATEEMPYGIVSSCKVMFVGGKIDITYHNADERVSIYSRVINNDKEDKIGRLIRNIVSDIVLTKFTVEQPPHFKAVPITDHKE